jgi:hypothetical protein
MVAVAVTQDEIEMARAATPPHLLLLLKRLGLGQISDPSRQSVMTLPGAAAAWERIRYTPHDDVVAELDAKS